MVAPRAIAAPFSFGQDELLGEPGLPAAMFYFSPRQRPALVTVSGWVSLAEKEGAN